MTKFPTAYWTTYLKQSVGGETSSGNGKSAAKC